LLLYSTNWHKMPPNFAALQHQLAQNATLAGNFPLLPLSQNQGLFVQNQGFPTLGKVSQLEGSIP
jgi:hypothetical protein